MTVTQQIQFRHDSALRWATWNPVLDEGEPGYETDTGKWKIGDGVSDWNTLGYMAEDGPRGLPGPMGPAGPTGAMGPAGVGVPGPAGATGPANTLTIGTVSDGGVGAATITGVPPNQILNLTLPIGATGPVGPQGIQGQPGAVGATGPAGPAGPVGPKGDQGIQGPKGDAAGINLKGYSSTWPPAAAPVANDLWLLPDPLPTGTPAGYHPGDGALWSGLVWHNVGPIRGPQGPQGVAGPAGSQGVQGVAGATGPAGPAGPQGPIGNPGPVGPVGPPGMPGPENNLTVGVVSELPPDQRPVVQIDGTSPNQTISFGLPIPYVPTMSIGTVSAGNTPAAWITGTPPDFVLNLILPTGSGGGSTHTTSFVTNPSAASVFVGDTATLSATAQTTEPPIVYRWQRLNVGTWMDVLNANGSTFTPDTTIAGTETYRCAAKTLSTEAFSQPATVTVAVRPPSNGTNWVGSANAIWQGPVTYAGGPTLFCFPGITSDGTTWKNIGASMAQTNYFQRPLWGNGFYATGQIISVLGDSWTRTYPTGTTGYPVSFAYSQQGNRYLGVYVTHDDRANTNTYDMYETADGMTWSKVTVTPPTSDVQTFLKNLYMFGVRSMWLGVVRSSAGLDELYYSTNGTAWGKATTGATLPGVVSGLNGVRFAAAAAGSPLVIMAIRPGIYAWRSVDGVNWTQIQLPTSAQWSDIQCGQDGTGGQLFMAIAKGTRVVITSPDGLTWTEATPLPEAGSWDSLAYYQGKWWAHKVRQGSEQYSMAVSG